MTSDEKDERIAALTARVTEVQGLNTRLENERRRYKLLHEATEKLFIAAVAEIPRALVVMGSGEPFAVSDLIREVHERNELLEADAWCNAAAAIREFVEEATPVIETQFLSDEGTYTTGLFLDRWRARFVAVLER